MFAVYTGSPHGAPSVEVPFQYYKTKPPFQDPALRLQMLEKLNAISGVSIPTDAITLRPNLSLLTLADSGRLDQFLAVMTWHVEAVAAQNCQ